MNVQTMKRTIATPTLCVTTRTDPTSVVVSVGIREMVKTAQVNIWYIDCKCARIFTTKSYNCLTFQPLLSAALHLVVQTRIACRKVAVVLFVNAVPGLRVMATSVQVAFCFVLLFPLPNKTTESRMYYCDKGDKAQTVQ